MESYLITFGISTLLMALKNPITKRKFRNAFLKVFNGIKSAFPNDPDFGTDALNAVKPAKAKGGVK